MSGVLKLFLEKLPEPVITMALFPSFLELYAVHEKEAKTHKCQKLINSLPAIHRLLLSYLLNFFNRIIGTMEKNKYASKDVAIFFGAALLRSKKGTNSIE